MTQGIQFGAGNLLVGFGTTRHVGSSAPSGDSASIHQEIAQNEQQISTDNEQIQTSQQASEQAQQQVTETQSAMESLNSVVSELSSTLSGLQGQLSSVQSALGSCQPQTKNEKGEMQDNPQYAQLQQQVAELESQVAETQALLEETQNSYNELQSQIEATQAEAESSEAETTSLEADIESCSAVIESLQAELEAIEQQQMAQQEQEMDESKFTSDNEEVSDIEKAGFTDGKDNNNVKETENNEAQKAQQTEAKSQAQKLLEEGSLTENVAAVTKNAIILLSPDNHTKEELEKAAQEVREYAKIDEQNKTETQQKVISLAQDVSNLSPSATLDDKKALQAKINDITKEIDAQNGVAPEVTNAIARALQELGTGEGEKDNTGDCLKYGGNEGEAWCAYFQNWLYDGILKDGGFTTGSNPDAYRNATDLQEGAKALGCYSPNDGSYTPQPGDIFNIGGDHVGMYLASDDNYMYAIEGNADNEVRLRRYAKPNTAEYDTSLHRIDDISGFVQMNKYYGGSSSATYISIYNNQLDTQLAKRHQNNV